MEITTRTSGDVTIVELRGSYPVDDGTSEFRDMIRTLIVDGQRQIVVNCLELPLLDSTAIGEFVQAYKLARAHGGAIKLVLLGEPLLPVLLGLVQAPHCLRHLRQRSEGHCQLRWREDLKDAVSPVELRQATVGYSDAAIRTAVVAGLLECPLPDVPADPRFADLGVFWLTDPDSWDCFPPPLPENTIAAIHRRLVASAH